LAYDKLFDTFIGNSTWNDDTTECREKTYLFDRSKKFNAVMNEDGLWQLLKDEVPLFLYTFIEKQDAITLCILLNTYDEKCS